MNPAQPSPSERDLEALSRQLRSLAQHLLRDSDAADDLVQEAWLAALNRPREHVAELGAWLSAVVRNLAARRVRREVLRRDAEFERASSEQARETEELLERSNIALALREAAHELPEPVRSVIVLHYFEGLSLEATAVRLARPLETVRSQRRRGIEALRGVLDRRHRGARRDWLAALTPLLGERPTRARGWRWAALAALASIALLGVGVWLSRTAPDEASGPALAALDTANESAPDVSAVEIDEPARADVAPPAQESVAPPSEPPSAPAAATKRFAARVTDADGRAVAGARLDVLGLDGAQLGPFTTGVDGRVAFELPVDKLSYRASFAGRGGIVVNAYASGMAKSLLALVPAVDGEQEFELALSGPGQTLTGIVRDADGAPIAEASIEIDNANKHMASAPGGVILLDDARRASSDAEGRFKLEGLPRRSHRWFARAKDTGLATGAVEGESEVLDVVITLPRGVEVAGVVRISSGAPAVNADVWVARGVGFNLLPPKARTDELGRYRLRGITERSVRIFARAAAGLDESADALHAIPEGVERTELDFELRARPPLEFVCIEADGRPVQRAMLVLETPADAPAPWRQSVSTDAEGRARYSDYPDAPLLAQLLPSGAVGEALRREFDARTTKSIELRVGVDASAAHSTVRIAVVDPWHAPIQARLLAVASADSSATQAAVDPRTGVVERLELPAGERNFFVVDDHGVTVIGAAELDGVSELDLGLHTLGSTRSIEVEWALAGGADLAWLLVAQLSDSCGYERLFEFAHGRTHFELRDGSYRFVGRSAAGDDRVTIPFAVGAGHPPRVVVK